MKLRRVIYSSVMFLGFAASVSGQSIVLRVTEDAYVCDCYPNSNNASSRKTYQGPYYFGDHKCYARTASYWNLGSLPQGITISQATIEFKCTAIYGSLTGEMVFYRFLQDWAATTITSNNAPPYTAQDSIVKNWPAAGQWLSLDATKLVRFWYEHSDSNFGLYGHCVNTTSNTGAVEFNSSQWSTSADRPKLTVTYTTTDVKSEGTMLPSDFQLHAYPNPFNPTTNISYTLERSGWVDLTVTDLSGRIVDQLVQAHQNKGGHNVQWNAGQVASGIYLVSITSSEKRAVKKVVLMK